jgi:catechol 2,3-dioxygenase-like lactoylglutathione lyase family enzyme
LNAEINKLVRRLLVLNGLAPFTIVFSSIKRSHLNLAMTNLTYIMPCFIIGELKISVAFYVDKLGFEVRYTGPDGDPYWAIVGRDNISIMLKAVAPDIKPISNRSRHEWAPTDAYISTAEPDTLFEEYRSRDVVFRKPIHDNSDELRGFEIEDADGYVLFFGRPNV